MNDDARAHQVRVWRGQMTLLGYETVRGRYSNRMAITDTPPHPDDECVSAWLKDQEAEIRRRETRRFWGMLVIAIIAMVAACIAAWPVLVGWFGSVNV
jgi:hypothetical protein